MCGTYNFPPILLLLHMTEDNPDAPQIKSACRHSDLSMPSARRHTDGSTGRLPPIFHLKDTVRYRKRREFLIVQLTQGAAFIKSTCNDGHVAGLDETDRVAKDKLCPRPFVHLTACGFPASLDPQTLGLALMPLLERPSSEATEDTFV
ncbi:hypothetical protein Bbelb_306610 [Branchiostoma belcheri]|nr:hypothetical protein Bbelb_306610 [Branchiostoma belcheri]